jgi:hypothetical protein
MKMWEDRFFALNKEIEVEVNERTLEQVPCATSQLGWTVDDQFWARDLHVSRLVRGDNELFLIQETYFGPKLTGSPADIAQLRAEALKINPNKDLFAGRSPTIEKNAQNKQ